MKDIMSKSVYNFELIQQERIGGILFFIATILGLIATDQEEKSIILTQMQQFSSQEVCNFTNNTTKIFALEGWIFLVGVLVFTNISYERLKEQEANMPTNAPLSSKKNLFASYVVVIGNIFKVIGFTLTAIGSQISANNT